VLRLCSAYPSKPSYLYGTSGRAASPRSTTDITSRRLLSKHSTPLPPGPAPREFKSRLLRHGSEKQELKRSPASLRYRLKFGRNFRFSPEGVCIKLNTGKSFPPLSTARPAPKAISACLRTDWHSWINCAPVTGENCSDASGRARCHRTGQRVFYNNLASD
jgi:hypothetical protein